MTSLIGLGDVMLARGVSDFLARADPAEVWGDTLPLIQSADIRLVNLECCISDRGREFQPPRVFYFRAIPKAINALLAAGIDVATLANNHTLDFGPQALLDTLDHLDSAGILFAGAGPDMSAAGQPVLLERAKTKIGIVAFTDNFPEYRAGPRTAGTNHLPIEHQSLASLASMIDEAREMGADVVIVSAHWGPNMRRRPPQHFRDFARSAIDAGGDIWFGHSAHLFQGVEFHRGKPIVYDAGDFLDDYRVDPVERNDLSLAWWFDIGPSEIGLAAYPLTLSFARTNMATGEDFDWIAKTLRGLCAEMGTTVSQDDSRLVLSPA
jgi:poly-gamma-glutamate capsule biosynthesis protein CapA/YwtB (metallophosphatase superfamily)